MKALALGALAESLFSNHPPAMDALASIPHMDLSTRKILLTICRVQRYPDPSTRINSRISNAMKKPWLSHIHSEGRIRYTTLNELLFPIHDHLESPILSGLWSMLVRNIPLVDNASAEREFYSSMEKEIDAAIETHHPTTFRWSSIFSHDRHIRSRTTFHDDYIDNIPLRHDLYHAFLGAKHRLSGMTIYPDIGKKTVGIHAQRRIAEFTSLHPLSASIDGNSILDLEKIYHETGIEIEGATEMRWAWKFNDLKPRLYYARGPSVYYASRYIQPVFNVLVDCLPVTNRYERFHTSHIRTTPGQRAFIYDYISFTSALHEIINFTTALATFLQGTKVTIIDTHQGPISMDLGDMMATFNDACNRTPQFDIGGLSWTRKGYEECLLHHNCGMLGVPGNIASCTLLHGIHLIMALSSMLAKVVGDDALGAGEESKETVNPLLANIGHVHPEKVEEWVDGEDRDDTGEGYDTSWQYVKRPIDLVDSRIVCGTQLTWPSLGVMLGLDDGVHTIQQRSEEDRIRLTAKMLTSFLAQYSRSGYEATGEEGSVINRFLGYVRRKVGLDNFVTASGLRLVYPRSFDDFHDPHGWIEAHLDHVVSVPDFWTPCSKHVDIGISCVVVGSKAVSLAEKLGYAEVLDMRVRKRVRDDVAFFYDFFLREPVGRPRYAVTVSFDVPDWLLLLISSPPGSEHDDDSFSDMVVDELGET